MVGLLNDNTHAKAGHGGVTAHADSSCLKWQFTSQVTVSESVRAGCALQPSVRGPPWSATTAEDASESIPPRLVGLISNTTYFRAPDHYRRGTALPLFRPDGRRNLIGRLPPRSLTLTDPIAS